jgi:hypothetical protein
MGFDPVLTTDEFDAAREQADDIWDDYEVFDEERDRVDFRELYTRLVEAVLIHPAGHSSYEMDEAVDTLISEIVVYELAEDFPDDIQEEFTQALYEEVSGRHRTMDVVEFYEAVRDDADALDSVGEIQALLDSAAAEHDIRETF